MTKDKLLRSSSYYILEFALKNIDQPIKQPSKLSSNDKREGRSLENKKQFFYLIKVTGDLLNTLSIEAFSPYSIQTVKIVSQEIDRVLSYLVPLKKYGPITIDRIEKAYLHCISELTENTSFSSNIPLLDYINCHTEKDKTSL